jgi:hypothetical protein
MHTTLLCSVAYIAFWFSQKTYRGFGCWTLAAISISCLYAALLLRLLPGEWFRLMSVIGVTISLPLSAILRADAILRFTENRKLPWYVYLTIPAVIPLNLYFFYFVQGIAVRYMILMLLVIPFNYIICKTLFSVRPGTGRMLYVCGGIFFLMHIVGLVFESIVMFTHRSYTSVFQSPDMGSYLLFTLLSEVGIALFFFMLNTQRSQEELLHTKTLLKNAQSGPASLPVKTQPHEPF